MTIIRCEYKDIRHKIKPGTVIAFGGNDNLSRIIKAILGGPVSHVGVVMNTLRLGEPPEHYTIEVIESCPISKRGSGVMRSRLSERLEGYDGDVWILSLNESLDFNQGLFCEFLLSNDGAGYSYKHAMLSMFEGLTLPFSRRAEPIERVFCSELIAMGLQEAGLLDEQVLTTRLNPLDLCRLAIYADEYYQVSHHRGYTDAKAEVVFDDDGNWDVKVTDLAWQPVEIPGWNSRQVQ
jgi:hypothetical protein